MTKKDMIFIANTTNFQITIHRLRPYKIKSYTGEEVTKTKVMKDVYNPSSATTKEEIENLEEFHIALYQNHYFIYEKIDDLYFNYIRKCGWRKGIVTYKCDSTPVDTLNLVKIMVEENFDDYLTPFSSEHFNSIYAQDISNDIVFKGDFDVNNDCRPIKPTENTVSQYSIVFLAVIEKLLMEIYTNHISYVVKMNMEVTKRLLQDQLA